MTVEKLYSELLTNIHHAYRSFVVRLILFTITCCLFCSSWLALSWHLL